MVDDRRFRVDGPGADARGPAVTGVALAGRGNGANGVFIAGDAIEVRVDFDEPVTVAGPPSVALWVGSATRYAAYASGSGTASLVFRYAAVSGDRDRNGVSVGASALLLNGGTIRDAAGNAAALGFGAHEILDPADFPVDGSAADVVGPTVTGVTVGGAASGANGVFIAGDAIEVTVEFHEAAVVTGTPRVALVIGSATRHADYASGSGTASAVFRYTVAAADADPDGLAVGASALSLNGGSIADASGNAAEIGLGAHAAAAGGAVVDGSVTDVAGPTVTGVSFSGIGNSGGGRVFIAGDVMTITVAFDEPVTVTGSPQLEVTLQGGAAQAVHASGSGTDSLSFAYTVEASHEAPSAVVVGASALTLNGGSIVDASGNAAALGLGTARRGYPVRGTWPDSVEPRVLAASLSGTGSGANGVFLPGDVISLTVTWHEPVTVTGAPRGRLSIGGERRLADYASGSGTASVTFRYTVAVGDADDDGVGVEDWIDRNGGRLRDAAGRDGSIYLRGHAPAADPDFIIPGDLVSPAVSGFALSGTGSGAGGVFIAGDGIEATVTFDEPVTVTGTPRLALGVGGETRQADYASGSGTASAVFRYTVVTADDDANGISVAASALSLNEGTIADAAGNAAALGLGDHAVTDGDLVVDGDGADTRGPTVTGLTLGGRRQGAAHFRVGDRIEATVEFHEPVTVTGTPGWRSGSARPPGRRTTRPAAGPPRWSSPTPWPPATPTPTGSPSAPPRSR